MRVSVGLLGVLVVLVAILSASCGGPPQVVFVPTPAPSPAVTPTLPPQPTPLLPTPLPTPTPVALPPTPTPVPTTPVGLIGVWQLVEIRDRQGNPAPVIGEGNLYECWTFRQDSTGHVTSNVGVRQTNGGVYVIVYPTMWSIDFRYTYTPPIVTVMAEEGTITFTVLLLTERTLVLTLNDALQGITYWYRKVG